MNNLWTKEKIQKIFQLWETKNTREIAEEVQMPMKSVSYMITVIRKEGGNLPKKSVHGYSHKLVKEVILSMK